LSLFKIHAGRTKKMARPIDKKRAIE